MAMKPSIPSFGVVSLIGADPVSSVSVNKKFIYKLMIWMLLILGIFVLIRLLPTLTIPEYLHSDDFIRYWASGRLNLQGQNPYNRQQIVQVQDQAGDIFSSTTESIVLNPPWAIPLLMPFGAMDYLVGRFAWLIVSILFVLLSSQVLWSINSGHPKQRWLAMLVVFIFAPTISMLEVGQIAAIILLGIVGFLYFTTVVKNDWLAGVSLALIAIKPQVILLFWLVLLFWVIRQRRWLIPISAFLTILLLTLIALVFNPGILQQYLGMLQTYQVSEWANPTIGSYLRYFWLGTDKFWPQFLPVVIGGFWGIYYWYKHHASWNWKAELPLILLVSQLTSPYSWTYDQVILAPAILVAVIWMNTDWKRWLTLVLAVLYMGLNILDMLLHMRLDDFWFIWMVPAVFILFIIIHWQYPKLPGNPGHTVLSYDYDPKQ